MHTFTAAVRRIHLTLSTPIAIGSMGGPPDVVPVVLVVLDPVGVLGLTELGFVGVWVAVWLLLELAQDMHSPGSPPPHAAKAASSSAPNAG
jgi:hypothetical protein